MNYYYLIAGLPELQMENPKSGQSLETLYAELQENLSQGDLELVDLLREGKELADDEATRIYYEKGCHCKNKFLRDWFQFCQNLNNALTQQVCKQLGWQEKDYMVGDFDPDFEEADLVRALTEEKNMLVREKKQDALKWKWLEEHTFFDFFGVEHVLAYWLQCELLERWNLLTQEEGTRVFRGMLDDLRENAKVAMNKE